MGTLEKPQTLLPRTKKRKKILTSLVTNFNSEFSKIQPYWSNRHGLKCKISLVQNIGNIGTKRENFFSVKGLKLFNILPADIRSSLNCDISAFKEKLDNFLSSVPDEPGVPGYCPGRAAASNSLLDQVPYRRRAWAEPGPQG